MIKKLIHAMIVFTMIFFHGFTYASLSDIPSKVSKEFQNQLMCLARNIYFEAAMESFEGKLAVAQVTMNRTRHPNFPNTVCDVVYQKINGIHQFSWVGEGVKKIVNSRAWEDSLLIARKALTEHKVHDTLYRTKAMYFHNTTVNPEWNLKYVVQIGNHLFYARH
jgi:N-acetylmuramoyl-L-alanine amidase